MKMLADELEAIGLSDIRTYIQSGNVVFHCSEERTSTLAEEISAFLVWFISFFNCRVG